MKKRYWWTVPVSVVVLVWAGFSALFSVPPQPQLLTLDMRQSSPAPCYQALQPLPLDNNGRLKLVVWNIYKENREHWHQALTSLGHDAHLLLLQEASVTPQLLDWAEQEGWQGVYTNAFRLLGTPAGVLNLARNMPEKACVHTQLEPWLRLPKSAIVARYPLSNGQTIMVTNIHAVNFSYGTQEYHAQLAKLVNELHQHSGPVIVAGDFNSWSERRTQALAEALAPLGLNEVSFSPDNRSRFINGLPLDHVYYKNLVLKSAQAPESDASDHNPMVVEFSVTESTLPK